MVQNVTTGKIFSSARQARLIGGELTRAETQQVRNALKGTDLGTIVDIAGYDWRLVSANG